MFTTHSFQKQFLNPISDENLKNFHRTHCENLHKRYAEAMKQLQLNEIWISSGCAQLRYHLDDNYWPFVATPSFTQWIPFIRPGNILRIQNDSVTLFQSTETSYWESAPVDRFVYDRSFFEIKKYNHLEDLQPFKKSKTCWVGADRATAQKLGFTDQEINSDELINELHFIRTQKSDYEVSCLIEAERIGARGHLKLAESFMHRDASEFELLLEYYAATKQVHDEAPYDAIVALGVNAATLHHVSYNRDVLQEPNLSLLVDAGGKFQGYCSDITRTHIKGKSPGAKKFAELLNKLNTLQLEMCKEFKIGQFYEDLHNQTHLKLAEILISLGIAEKTSPEELVDAEVTRNLLPHGLGHSLGLQVHDVGMRKKAPAKKNPFLRNTSQVQEGQVVTIEPGIYFIPSLLNEMKEKSVSAKLNWPLIQELSPFGGIRIEDNILATKDGPINLTRPFLP